MSINLAPPTVTPEIAQRGFASPTGEVATAAYDYEERLNADWELALAEGGKHFEERSAVQSTLRRVTRDLINLEIPYAVVGGMALFRHGLRRFIQDVDVLVSAESLQIIHSRLEGRGRQRLYNLDRMVHRFSMAVPGWRPDARRVRQAERRPPFTNSKNLRDETPIVAPNEKALAMLGDLAEMKRDVPESDPSLTDQIIRNGRAGDIYGL